MSTGELALEGFDLSALLSGEQKRFDAPPDLFSYQTYLVAFSGGKDSLALVLHLLDLGVPREKIELHHHCVDDPDEGTFMDWPCTPAYCRAFAEALGLRITFSWRRQGFRGEMLRVNAPTNPMLVPAEHGGYTVVGGDGPLGTRRKFPQVSADLSVRWCSSSLKISLLDAYLRSHPKFLGQRTLVLTGERAEESASRARYAQFENHRADTRSSTRVPRHIDVWRAVHQWSEARVWSLIARWRIETHPAYRLGWSRTSCRLCSQAVLARK